MVVADMSPIESPGVVIKGEIAKEGEEPESHHGDLLHESTHHYVNEETSRKTKENVKNAISSKSSRLVSIFEGSAAPHTLRQLVEFREGCSEQLPADDPLFAKIDRKIAERSNTHRSRFIRDLEEKDSLTMKKLLQIEHACSAELPSSDPIFERIQRRRIKREKVVKILEKKFAKMMSEKIHLLDVNQLHNLLNECQEELENEHPLLAQIRSTIQVRVSDNKVKCIKSKTQDTNDEFVLAVAPPQKKYPREKKPKTSTRVSTSTEISGSIPFLDSPSWKIRFLALLILCFFGFITYLTVDLVNQVAPWSVPNSAPVVAVPTIQTQSKLAEEENPESDPDDED